MLTVLMGAPGAGKSTWLKRNATEDEYIATSEMVRMDREIDVAAYMNNMRIKGAIALQGGRDVIVDATNTITAHRLFWLKCAKANDIKTRIIIFNTNLSSLLAAQKIRQFPAPNNVVIKHHKNMSIAMKLVDDEGWDQIVRIYR